MPDANTLVNLEETLRAQVARGDLGDDEKRESFQALVLLSPSEGMRWAALAGSWPERGAQLLHRAIILIPGDFRLYINQSNRHVQAEAGGKAFVSLRRAALLQPDLARVSMNLSALMANRAKRWKFQSRAWVQGCLEGTGLGQVERQIAGGQILEPLEVVEKALRSSVLLSDAWRLRGVLQQRLYKSAESRRSYCRALICDPANLNAYIAASSYFIERRSFTRATRLLNFADILVPGAFAVLANRAAILERTGRLEEALTIARRLAVLYPHNGERYFIYGTILQDMANVADALTNLRRAGTAAPKDQRFQNNLAIALLKSGLYSEGFAAYEGRWFAPAEMPTSERSLWPNASFDLPLWEPGRSTGGKILLWGEQGVGDEIWGLSYLTALAGRPEHFTVEIDARLVPLVKRCFPAIKPLPRHVDMQVDISSYQAQLPLLSLPHRLGLAERQTPASWMRPGPGRVAATKHRLTGGRSVRLIGLAWRSIKPLQHLSFSIGFEKFSALKAIEDAVFLPLQYDMEGHEWDALISIFGADRVVRPDFDVRDDLVQLADAIAATDVVVTLATALVPMAVATDTRSVVMLMPVQRDWRYRVDAEDSPMLPCSTLLWPPESEDSESLLRAVIKSLP